MAKKYRLRCKCKGGSLISGGYNPNTGGTTMGKSCKCKVFNTRLSKKTTEIDIEWVSLRGGESWRQYD